VKYAFIAAERRHHSVRALCRVLEVTMQGFYSWQRRPLSERAQEDVRLTAEIRVIHAESKCRYGSPRVHDELKDRGRRCGRHRVARLMQQANLRAKAGRKYRATTDSAHDRPVATDLVERRFSAERPDQIWVSDITYLRTAEGWLYLAVFLDVYSRMVVGWATGERISGALLRTAFARACARRRPPAGLIVHSDRGSQYASSAFRELLDRAGALQSMGSSGDCYDNALVESFFHSLKVEAIHGEEFDSRRRIEYEVFDYIERFYNKMRKHSALGLRSPAQFEAKNINRKAAA
jgi:transposase InsO family protein